MRNVFQIIGKEKKLASMRSYSYIFLLGFQNFLFDNKMETISTSFAKKIFLPIPAKYREQNDKILQFNRGYINFSMDFPKQSK
jgi:hypothetical protein